MISAVRHCPTLVELSYGLVKLIKIVYLLSYAGNEIISVNKRAQAFDVTCDRPFLCDDFKVSCHLRSRAFYQLLFHTRSDRAKYVKLGKTICNSYQCLGLNRFGGTIKGAN